MVNLTRSEDGEPLRLQSTGFFRHDRSCRRAVIQMALIWALVTAGLLVSHPETGLDELLSLPGIYILFVSVSSYLALMLLAWWGKPFSRRYCLILSIGASGLGVLGMLTWYLVIATWPGLLSVVMLLVYVPYQWLILAVTLVLLLVVYWVERYREGRRSS